MIPSSMSLVQYVEAHWLAMDPELVNLIHRTLDRENEAREEEENHLMGHIKDLEDENSSLQRTTYQAQTVVSKLQALIESYFDGSINKTEFADFYKDIKL